MMTSTLATITSITNNLATTTLTATTTTIATSTSEDQWEQSLKKTTMGSMSQEQQVEQEPHSNNNVTVLEPTRQLKSLLTIIRNKNTARGDFIFYSDRVIRLLVEEALNHLPYNNITIKTPTGTYYQGLTFYGEICGVSIMRAGEAMEQGLRDCCRSVRIGKILIQRDEETANPTLFYSKLPKDIASRYVLLLDPMLATGGSANKAIEVLMEQGVPEENIIFVNLISCPEGIDFVLSQHPKLKIVTAEIDQGLDERKYIYPGLGDFGCRYFGTDD